MCGRYTLAVPDIARLRERFPVGEQVQVRLRYNIAPGDDVLAVTTDRDGAPRGELLRWGLVPSWAPSPDTGLKLINARAETAFEKPAFRTSIQRFRCLIIADGFYEWRRGRAFHITRPDREPFAFAGLWSSWRPPNHSIGGRPSAASGSSVSLELPGDVTAAPIRSCAILTTAAAGEIAALHDRMPIALEAGAEQTWLDATTTVQVVAELLRSASPLTDVREVGPAVNDARYDGPACLEPPLEQLQSALF